MTAFTIILSFHLLKCVHRNIHRLQPCADYGFVFILTASAGRPCQDPLCGLRLGCCAFLSNGGEVLVPFAETSTRTGTLNWGYEYASVGTSA